MKAKLLYREKITDEDGDLREMVLWAVSHSNKYPGGVRYRMAFIPHGAKEPSVLYDNHHPKGHHKHIRGKEEPYHFLNSHQLLVDFEKDIELWKRSRRKFP